MTTTQMAGSPATSHHTDGQVSQPSLITARPEKTARYSRGQFGRAGSITTPMPTAHALTVPGMTKDIQCDRTAFWDEPLLQRMTEITVSAPNSAATPEPAVIAELRLVFAYRIANKLASFLDEIAEKSGMPVTRTVVSRRTFLSDGKTRIFVRQYITKRPEEVVEYADASSIEIDAWIDSLPARARSYFDDNIAVDIYWA